MADSWLPTIVQDVLPVDKIDIGGPKHTVSGKVDDRAVGEHGADLRPWVEKGGGREDLDVVGGREDKVLLAIRVVPDGWVAHDDITCTSLMSVGWQTGYDGWTRTTPGERVRNCKRERSQR